MDFGIKLKKLRIGNNLTQLELSKILNSSKSNISKYEAGLIEPNLETLVKISNYFYVSVDYLLGIDHSKEITNLNLHVNRQLSPNEESLLQVFEHCNEECQQYLIAKARVLSVEGISAVASGEYGKYIDEEKKSHPLNGTEGTGN